MALNNLLMSDFGEDKVMKRIMVLMIFTLNFCPSLVQSGEISNYNWITVYT